MAAKVEVPFEMLSAEALDAMLEEFVLREGTDYGHSEHTLPGKIAQVKAQVEAGKIRILYDEATESFDIVRKNTFEQQIKQQ